MCDRSALRHVAPEHDRVPGCGTPRGAAIALAALNPIAASHHEKVDGSGYHKSLRADAIGPEASILAAVEIYVALTTDRADRPAFSGKYAATELRRLATEGALKRSTADAVLVAAGHDAKRGPTSRRAQYSGGLTGREVEVLRLAAKGLTTGEIASKLYISPKTADHHIQHVYTKIGVSTGPPQCCGQCNTPSSADLSAERCGAPARLGHCAASRSLTTTAAPSKRPALRSWRACCACDMGYTWVVARTW